MRQVFSLSPSASPSLTPGPSPVPLFSCLLTTQKKASPNLQNGPRQLPLAYGEGPRRDVWVVWGHFQHLQEPLPPGGCQGQERPSWATTRGRPEGLDWQSPHIFSGVRPSAVTQREIPMGPAIPLHPVQLGKCLRDGCGTQLWLRRGEITSEGQGAFRKDFPS